jgi:hypothetical protein
MLNVGRFAIVLSLLILGAEGTFYHLGGWNQYARVGATVAFVEPGTPFTGTFRIDAVKDSSRLGTSDWAEYQGAFYSNKAPGVSFLGVLPYFVLYHAERGAGLDPRGDGMTAINVWAINLWISALWNIVAAVTLLRLLPRLGVHSQQGAAFIALVYAFGTLVLPFACSAWGHPTAAAFILLGTLNLGQESRRHCVLAGFWLGMAALTEYLAALSLVVAAFFILSGPDRSERLWRLITGSAAPVAVLLLYHEFAFGSYFTSAASLSNPVFLQPGRVAGLFGPPNLGNLVRMLFAPGRGLFWQTPVLLAFAFGARTWYRTPHRRFLGFALANITIYALSISAMDAYGGGLTTSMRYMIITLPFFCVLMPDIRRVAYPRMFLLAYIVSAANMFVLAATSTMYPTEFPLSGYAYPDFLHGQLRFNPLFALTGVGGIATTVGLTSVYAVTLGWLLWSVLANPRPLPARPERPGFSAALSIRRN